MDKQNPKESKIRGAAMVALRAFIKALEMRDGNRFKSDGKYRYEFSADGTTARIFTVASGEDVDGFNRSVEDWAKDGKSIRLAFIGLKDAKIALEEEASRSRETANLRFTLDAISGEAFLEKNRQRLADKPATIADWAKVGREVEKTYFDRLNSARDYGSKDGVTEARAAMELRGIIRARAKGSEQE